MPIQSSNFGSLSEAAQLQKLKSARVALWIVGILTILVNGFFFFNAQDEFEKAYEAELKRQGVSMAELRALDKDTLAEIDKEKSDGLAKVKLIYGAGLGLGVIFIVCALLVNRKPVIATMTGLVLYLGSIAATAAFEPESLAKGLIMKVIIIAVLAGAVKAAIAYERDQRQKVA
jgi:VIT1/CCC1 family predicted Fe2+/Mn2+ transporter